MNRTLIAVVLAVSVVFGFALASLGAGAQAPVPIHNVGDSVGFGATMNLGDAATPLLDQLRAIDASDPNITINELNFTGSMDIWATMEVVEETSIYYAIQENTAVGVQAHFIADVTSTQFPEAGTHAGTIDPTFGCLLPDIPPTTATASADLQIAYLSTSSGVSKWNVSDFALRESRTNHTVDLRVTSVQRNIPNLDINLTACQIVVTYEDSTLTITADVNAEIRVAFSPALDYFDFPIFDNETWPAFSNATVAGRIAGTINVVGLDPDEEQEFFDALNAAFASSGLTVTGLTGFPIVLEDITVQVGLDTYLRDGVIDDIPESVALSLHARQATKTLADGNFHTVYLISEAPVGGFAVSPCSWVYSPDDGFIVGYVCEAGPGISIFELENVPPNDARQEITDTKANYAVGAGTANPFADFFLKAPFFGLLLVAAVVLVVAALLMRRRPPAAAMPPPPMPPPEGPPPEVP